MKKIAFLGGGKIGSAMMAHALADHLAEVVFVYDPFLHEDAICDVKVISALDKDQFLGLDLVVECATAEVLAEHGEQILACCDLMSFSLTAFRDDELTEAVRTVCAKSGHRVYLHHGAILGLDGIFDGRDILTGVTVETIKHPKSLNREDKERTVLFEGSAREAAGLYPRNVNVHAAIALAGIGFDRTVSKIISDPAVDTNTHLIHLMGEGIDFTIRVSSFSEGGVSGTYVPLSACGSLDRVLGGGGFQFV